MVSRFYFDRGQPRSRIRGLSGVSFWFKAKPNECRSIRFVQAIGGIHEVYFPFVLLDPCVARSDRWWFQWHADLQILG